ncbi:MAG: 50S ribosomal protein L13 [Spirochaetales bacterium]|nr:50S ribosomal protein L13 [Spirochaetales bacterium]
MKTIFVKQKDVEKKWYIVDAAGKRLGRIAVRVATILRGKHKPIFSPHMDTGDYVIIINADKVQLTGRKKLDKIYYRHSGYPSGLKSENFTKVIQRKPTFPLEHAIKGMLPKGPLGRKIYQHVKIYCGENHPHMAQKPEELTL